MDLSEFGVVLFDSDPDIDEFSAKGLVFVGAHRKLGFSMREISFEGVHAVCDSVMAAAKDFPNLLIVVSGRVLDRAFCEGSPPGGLSTRELMYFLNRLSLLQNARSVLFRDCDSVLQDKLKSALAKPL